MKRFVLLGSAVSVLNSHEDITTEGQPYTEKDWNPVWTARVDHSQGSRTNHSTGYCRRSHCQEGYSSRI